MSVTLRYTITDASGTSSFEIINPPTVTYSSSEYNYFEAPVTDGTSIYSEQITEINVVGPNNTGGVNAQSDYGLVLLAPITSNSNYADSFYTESPLFTGSVSDPTLLTGTFVAVEQPDSTTQAPEVAEITIEAVCYLEGTRILTPTGERPVEALEVGDDLVTRYGGIRRIKWIGRQRYSARFVKTNRDQIPVRIIAGALGDRLPARDLFVSPGHSMLVGERLILAKFLVNGVSITQEFVPEEICYYQIEFETHDCVIAEGTWAESYADVEGMRGRFHNAEEFLSLYPDYRAPEALSLCALRPEGGPALEVALRPVVARASAGLAPGALRGWIDAITDGRTVEGWAQDVEYPEMPVLLEVLCGESVIGTILACDHRADLQAAGLGQGRCAFTFDSLIEITPAMVRVRRAVDGAKIAMSADCMARLGKRRAA